MLVNALILSEASRLISVFVDSTHGQGPRSHSVDNRSLIVFYPVLFPSLGMALSYKATQAHGRENGGVMVF